MIIECRSLAVKWKQLSAYLGLDMDTINGIEENNVQISLDCWNEALWRWITQKYNTQKFGLPSWRTLLNAMALLDGTLLAKELASKYQGECLQVATIII